MVVRGHRAGYVTLGWQILVVAAGYFLAAKLGLQLALVGDQVSPMWPPSGIALACLLLFGIRCWPGITVGAFLANVAIGPTLPAVLAISAGNTLASVCAYLLLARVGFRIELDRLRDALALVFLGAVGAMLTSATVGALTLLLVGAQPASSFWGVWSVWWAGDAMGVLVVTPVLLVASAVRWRGRVSPWRLVEAAALLLGTVAVTLVITGTHVNLLFPAFPVLIWAAVRFQQRGAAPCALIVSTGAVLAAVHGTGTFAGMDLLPKMVTLHAFNATAALTALLLAAITTQRNQAVRSVERAVAQLSDAVATLEPYSLLRDGMLRNVLRARSTSDQR